MAMTLQGELRRLEAVERIHWILDKEVRRRIDHISLRQTFRALAVTHAARRSTKGGTC